MLGNHMIGRLWRFLTSLQLAIGLLACITVASVVGTVIPQNESPHWYMEAYRPSTYAVIRLLGLDDMYHAWWFTTLMALFTVNLACCTARRMPLLRRELAAWSADKASAPMPQKGQLHKNIILKLEAAQARAAVAGALQACFGRPAERQAADGSPVLFAEKGRYARLGFYATHVGVILIIIGGLLGNLGYQGFMKLIEGETSDTFVLRGSGQAQKLDFAIRCDAFEATFYAGSQRPKDFKSTLTVVDGEREIFTKVIEVNDPLQYKGVWIYQSSYGTASGAGEVLIGVAASQGSEHTAQHRVKIGERFALDDNRTEVHVKQFVPDFSIGEDKKIFSRSEELRNPAVQLALYQAGKVIAEKWIFANFPDFHGSQEGAFNFSLLSFYGKEFTGLQITRDPGVWVVWAGCLLLIAGCYLVFFTSHRRIWVALEPGTDGVRATLAGSSSKNLELFKKTFDRLCARLQG